MLAGNVSVGVVPPVAGGVCVQAVADRVAARIAGVSWMTALMQCSSVQHPCVVLVSALQAPC